MLRWYNITAPNSVALRNVMKSLREQHLMVRKRDDKLIVCASTDHQVWLSRVCKDFNASLAILDKSPKGVRIPSEKGYTAPCGMRFFDPQMVAVHIRYCSVCKTAKREKPREVIAKLEPGIEFNLDGAISSLEVMRDKWWERVETLDNLLTNLKAYRDATEKLSELQVETDKRINTVRLLLKLGE